MRISDWSSDVCSSDLLPNRDAPDRLAQLPYVPTLFPNWFQHSGWAGENRKPPPRVAFLICFFYIIRNLTMSSTNFTRYSLREIRCWRSEEHTSELQSLMRISYAVFCLKKKKQQNRTKKKKSKTNI